MSLAKAHLLLQTRRYRDAEQELRRTLGQEPNNSEAHSMLALTLLAQSRQDEAVHAARTGVHLAPAIGYSHFVLALIYLRCDRIDEAQKAILEAIRLNPLDARFHSLLSEIYIERNRWNDALKAAEESLRLAPEDVKGLSMRALALIRLGRTDEARMSLDTARSLEPENASIHALQGWMHFNQKQYEAAFSSFGEALRLNPNIELAQEGIVEAMKARNPIYRLMLNYYLWLARMDSTTKWRLLIGGYLIVYFGRQALQDTPFLIPFIAVYVTFVFLTWTSETLFDLLLRFDRFGRRALSRERTIASNWVGLCLLTGGVLLVGGAFTRGTLQPALFEAGIKMVVLILPVAGVFQAYLPQSRRILAVYSLALAALTLWGFIAGLQGETEALNATRLLFLLGIIVYTWIGNIIINRR